jgi:hypothetical protein
VEPASTTNPPSISIPSFNLSDIAGTDPAQMLNDASPALRAALERQYSQEMRASHTGGFNSFIDPDL